MAQGRCKNTRSSAADARRRAALPAASRVAVCAPRIPAGRPPRRPGTSDVFPRGPSAYRTGRGAARSRSSARAITSIAFAATP